MLFGTDSVPFYQDTTTQVAIITTIGLVIVALIGVYTAKVTSGARQEITTKTKEASESADVAKDYATALLAKNALIDSMDERVKFLERQDKECKEKLEELERREDEYREQQRAASSLERNYSQEIDDLKVIVEGLRSKKPS